jgi:hypothetical protein
MDALGHFIVDPSIRRHLHAVLAACPVFRRSQEFPAYAPVAMVLGDEQPST